MGRLWAIALVLAALGSQERMELYPQWVRQLPSRKPAWDYTPKMIRDTAYEPLAVGGLVVAGCEHNGAILALDAATGEERWRFYTEGPVRFAPATDGERLFAGSDDGHLYALDLGGRLLWKFGGGRSGRRILGHERLISAWPVSARPVAAGGRVYVIAGYWPVDGIFVHALEAATGKLVWTNPGAQYRPFGSPRIVGSKLFVDGHAGSGAYDLETGAASSEKPPPRDPAPPPPELPEMKGTVVHRVRSGDRRFASTAEGALYGFGPSKVEPRSHPASPPEARQDAGRAEAILEATGVREGYALLAGLEDGTLLESLVRASKLHVVAADADAAKVDRIRRRLDPLFETRRLSIVRGTEGLPPYFASLVLSESSGAPPNDVLGCLRPYGGAWVAREGGEIKVTRRDGPPPGAADWTHEMADEAMTLCSRDKLVKAPLGLLWYGGPAADLRFYFDGTVDHQSGDSINPQPTGAQIVEGRMILQGPGLLGAFDIYTGRLLWETKIPRMYPFGGKLGGLGIHSKKHPEPWRAPEAMEAEVPPTHHPRASGFNMVSSSDAIYVGAAGKCLRFRPEDGRLMSSWDIPLPEPGLCWGNLWISGETLVATAFRPQDLADASAGFDGNGGDWAGDRMPMAWVFATDRKRGKLLWSRKAEWGFLNRGLAIGKETVFALDLHMEEVLRKLKAAGRSMPQAAPAVRALDLATGAERWSFPLDVLVKTLHYSRDRDLLVVACRHRTDWKDGEWVATDRKQSAPGKMRGLRGDDGKVLWEVAESPYAHPIVIVGDLLIDRWGNPFDLLTGKRHQRPSTLLGGTETWSFPRGGCNHLVACEAMVTWRTAFYDLAAHSGVTKLAGMDAGCTATLLPAGGVLNVPDFGTHHKRNRMTALALIHRPENAPWTDYAEGKPSPARPIRRAGFHFGAPGDRTAPDGTVWFRVGAKAEMAAVQPADVEWFETPTSSGVIGAAHITIATQLPANLKGKDSSLRRYTVRLHFVEPRAAKAGDRVYSVALEGKTVLEDFDPVREPQGPVVKEFPSIVVTGPLDVTLTAKSGKTLLCGVEIRLEE
jgi:outer membrane protein assembly factor BamB